jgi:hypothetical protein
LMVRICYDLYAARLEPQKSVGDRRQICHGPESYTILSVPGALESRCLRGGHTTEWGVRGTKQTRGTIGSTEALIGRCPELYKGEKIAEIEAVVPGRGHMS